MNLPRPSAGFSPLAREVAPLAQKPTGCRCPPSPPLLRYQWACPRVGESPRTQEPSAVFTPRQSRNSVIAGPSFSGLPWGPPGEWGTDLPCSQIPQTSGSRSHHGPSSTASAQGSSRRDSSALSWTHMQLYSQPFPSSFFFFQHLEFFQFQQPDGNYFFQPPRLKHFCLNVQKSFLFCLIALF